MSSKDRSIRKIALIVLLSLLQNSIVFGQYLDCMCLAAVPGLVLINTRIIKQSKLESFYAFWMMNKNSLKQYSGNAAVFDNESSALSQVHLPELIRNFKSGATDKLIDPYRVPVLVNFQPKLTTKVQRSVSKENRVPRPLKTEGDSKLGQSLIAAVLPKTRLPHTIKFSTTTNSLYKQLSELIR